MSEIGKDLGVERVVGVESIGRNALKRVDRGVLQLLESGNDVISK